MARERVYAHDDPTYDDGAPRASSETHREPTLPGVQVQWTPGANLVAVATGHLVDAPFVEPDAEAARRPVAELVAVPYHVWLTRAEVNELVRKLRRARNSAFGADE